MVKTDKNFVIAETHPTRTPRFLRLQKKCVIMYLILLLSDLRFIGSVNQSSRIETKTALTLEYFRYSEGETFENNTFPDDHNLICSSTK